MSNDDWIQILRSIPPEEHTKMVLVLKTNLEITVDTLVKLDLNFLVVRGRQGGTIDEARGFFVPYSELLTLRIERVMKVEEITNMANLATQASDQSKRPTPLPGSLPTTADVPMHPPSKHPTPLAPTDPAAASRLLMDRIRAARAQGMPVKNPSVS